MTSLRILRAFVAVFDHESVVGAARALGYSPAAISRQLSVLQGQLGFPLFVPAGRGIESTPEAADLVQWAREVVASADDFEEHLRRLRLSGSRPLARVTPQNHGAGVEGLRRAN